MSALPLDQILALNSKGLRLDLRLAHEFASDRILPISTVNDVSL